MRTDGQIKSKGVLRKERWEQRKAQAERKAELNLAAREGKLTSPLSEGLFWRKAAISPINVISEMSSSPLAQAIPIPSIQGCLKGWWPWFCNPGPSPAYTASEKQYLPPLAGVQPSLVST